MACDIVTYARKILNAGLKVCLAQQSLTRSSMSLSVAQISVRVLPCPLQAQKHVARCPRQLVVRAAGGCSDQQNAFMLQTTLTTYQGVISGHPIPGAAEAPAEPDNRSLDGMRRFSEQYARR